MIAWLTVNTDLAQSVIALCAIVVAVASLYVACRANLLQWRHNQLSVQPDVSLGCGDYENYLYICLENRGLGPSKVGELQVRSASKLMDQDDIWKFVPALPDGVAWNDYIGKIQGRSLPAGESVMVLELKDDRFKSWREFEDYKWKFRKSLSDVSYELTYSDIYGRQFSKAGDFSWFGRMLGEEHKLRSERSMNKKRKKQ
ncbi:hypothetical protein [Marinibacterium sp. SX1]|uniref:hypothetical protein n=1 Tax=Marinibacterium sp. SX1 TaxID=3388424 RepID=UPI003D183528